jgi:DNA-binding response OmpR family regulator
VSDLRVLVLDDDELQLDLIKRFFSYEGIVVEVSKGPASLPSEAGSFAPDFVLVDVNVPGVTRAGLPALISSARTGSQKIYLFSAEDETALRALVIETGADGYLSKGTSLPVIIEKLKAAAKTARHSSLAG